VVVTADRGLAGAFNAQVIKQAEQFLRGNPENVALVCIGKKGYDYFRTKKWPIAWAVTDLNAKISSQRANEIADRLMDGFLKEKTDEVLLLYNRFISTLVYRPAFEPVLPLRAITGQATGPVREYLLEPSPDAVLQALLPRFVRSKVFIMLAETFTAEHSARMVAMSGATRNCEELTDKLTLRLNKLRQAAITKEIIEIVSGAEALKA
jgi:F-type H+-transporting ATPase subunit gamma